MDTISIGRIVRYYLTATDQLEAAYHVGVKTGDGEAPEWLPAIVVDLEAPDGTVALRVFGRSSIALPFKQGVEYGEEQGDAGTWAWPVRD